MSVLVTGCGGFAGGCIARRLAEAGYEVVALTRRSPVIPPNSAAARARFRVAAADLADPATDLPACESIVHAAATSAWHGISVAQMIDDNVTVTRRLVGHALDTGCRRFFFCSSLSAFGAIGTETVDETLPPIAPDAYGTTKLLGEQLLADVAGRLPSLAIRLPAVIGPGSRRNWLSETLRKLKAGEPLVYVNPDKPFNNAVHEADLAAMIAGLLSRTLHGHDMIVVGAAGQLPVREVVRRLAAAIGSRSEIVLGDRSLRHFLIDSRKAQDRYSFRPQDIAALLDRFAAEHG